MPFINTKVNFSLTQTDICDLKNRLGDAISIIGKPERYLMLNFEDEQKMFFGGEDDFKMAMIEVKVFGKVRACDEMTAKVTEIFSDALGIEPDNIYVKYEECSLWGMGGQNF